MDWCRTQGVRVRQQWEVRLVVKALRATASPRTAHGRLPTTTIPAEPVSLRVAAAILGCSTWTVRQYVAAGRLAPERSSPSRQDVEALAAEIYDWRKHYADPDAFWVTGQRAADALGVSMSRLAQLTHGGVLPFLQHRDGTRLYYRSQLTAMARSGRR